MIWSNWPRDSMLVHMFHVWTLTIAYFVQQKHVYIYIYIYHKSEECKYGPFWMSFHCALLQQSWTHICTRGQTRIPISNVYIFTYIYIYNYIQSYPAGGFNPIEKYWSNWIILSGRGEHTKYLKPTMYIYIYTHENTCYQFTQRHTN